MPTSVVPLKCTGDPRYSWVGINQPLWLGSAFLCSTASSYAMRFLRIRTRSTKERVSHERSRFSSSLRRTRRIDSTASRVERSHMRMVISGSIYGRPAGSKTGALRSVKCSAGFREG
jgi:hypothetical protein